MSLLKKKRKNNCYIFFITRIWSLTGIGAAIILIVIIDRLFRHTAYWQPEKETEKERKSSRQTYIWEAHRTISLHCFLDLIQAAVVPSRKLETQWPVRRNDRPASELDNIIGHILNAFEVARKLTNHNTTDLTIKHALYVPLENHK